jgi:hypothetical protein
VWDDPFQFGKGGGHPWGRGVCFAGDFLYLIREWGTDRKHVIESRARRSVKRWLSIGGVRTTQGTFRGAIPMSSNGVSKGSYPLGGLIQA